MACGLGLGLGFMFLSGLGPKGIGMLGSGATAFTGCKALSAYGFRESRVKNFSNLLVSLNAIKLSVKLGSPVKPK